MSNRSSELLQEMLGIFGDTFGASSTQLLDETRGSSDSRRHSKKSSTPSERIPMKKKGGQSLSGKKDSSPNDRNIAKAKEAEKSHKKSTEKAASASAPSGGDSKEKTRAGSQASSASKSAKRHNPFKRNANLGTGPRGKHLDQTKCWKCKCGNVYGEGCNCVSSGSGANCPDKGTTKHITYHKDYKHAYNNEYHAWRAKQGGAVTRRIGSKS